MLNPISIDYWRKKNFFIIITHAIAVYISDIIINVAVEKLEEVNLVPDIHGNITVGTQVTFKCINGYKMTGDSLLSVISNGSWSSAFPQCSGIVLNLYLF